MTFPNKFVYYNLLQVSSTCNKLGIPNGYDNTTVVKHLLWIFFAENIDNTAEIIGLSYKQNNRLIL